MAAKEININEENIYEWMCSTGYFLPTNERELSRFEKLFPSQEIHINENSIDPIAIINGTRKRKRLTLHDITENSSQEIDELRMAARKHQDLPSDLIEKLKKNQKKDGESDHSKDQN